jgi:NAD+ kinase
MKFVLFGSAHQTKNPASAGRLLQHLQDCRAEILICREFYQLLQSAGIESNRYHMTPFDGTDFEADIAVSIGGDGTFLQAASRVGRKNIPILGINTGRLGFLADTLPEETESMIDDIYAGRYEIEERSVLQLQAQGEQIESPYALNDIAILKRDTSSMISIHTAINGEYLTTYQADGLVIATPTGSTAYSLSVGGPIMVPQAGNFVVTPIAPHSLNMRPLVICDSCEITLDVESRSHSFRISIDGRSRSMNENARLTITRADYKVRIIKRPERTFFETLRNKMMWGTDRRI